MLNVFISAINWNILTKSGYCTDSFEHAYESRPVKPSNISVLNVDNINT